MKPFQTLLVALAVCSVLTAGTQEASACEAPDELLELEATVPADEAVGVGLTTPIIAHFQVNPGYDYTSHFAPRYQEIPITMTVADSTGAEVARLESQAEFPWSQIPDRAILTLQPQSLEPGEAYTVTLEQNQTQRTWSFRTGDDRRTEFDPPREFEASVSAYFGERPFTECCPISAPGECPVCFDIGNEPLPAVDASFRLFNHPEGPAALLYTLEQRAEAADQSWQAVTSAAFQDSEREVGSLTHIDHRLRSSATCFRVIARSALDPDFEATSTEHCQRGEEHYGETPEFELDYTQVMCDEEEEEDVPEDDVEEEASPETDSDPMAEPEANAEEPSANGATYSARGSDGCSSTGANGSGDPGLLVVLAIGLLLFQTRRL